MQARSQKSQNLLGIENVDIIQQYVLRTLPGTEPSAIQSIVLPIKLFAVTKIVLMNKIVEVVR